MHSSVDLAAYHPRNGQREDAISYLVIDDPILALHGHYPPTNLLLVCKAIYHEARQQFLSTTSFEVHPLTPSDDTWIFEYYTSLAQYPAYETLGKSIFVSAMQKVYLRINIARFLTTRVRRPCPPHGRLVTISMFEAIGLKKCTQMLTWGSKTLCKALKKSASSLRLVEICWVDDFPHDISPHDLDMRAAILQPLSELVSVDVRIKKLVMIGNGREALLKTLKNSLRAVPGRARRW